MNSTSFKIPGKSSGRDNSSHESPPFSVLMIIPLKPDPEICCEPAAYKTWFEPIVAVKLTDNALSIQVPSKFFYEWLEEHYVKLLKVALTKKISPVDWSKMPIAKDKLTDKPLIV